MRWLTLLRRGRPRGRSSIIIPAGGANCVAWAAFRDALLRMEGASGQVLIEVRRPGQPQPGVGPAPKLAPAQQTGAYQTHGRPPLRRRRSWLRCGAHSSPTSRRRGPPRRKRPGRCWCAPRPTVADAGVRVPLRARRGSLLPWPCATAALSRGLPVGPLVAVLAAALPRRPHCGGAAAAGVGGGAADGGGPGARAAEPERHRHRRAHRARGPQALLLRPGRQPEGRLPAHHRGARQPGARARQRGRPCAGPRPRPVEAPRAREPAPAAAQVVGTDRISIIVPAEALPQFQRAITQCLEQHQGQAGPGPRGGEGPGVGLPPG